MKYYIIAWTGGYGQAQYAYRATKEAGLLLAQEWATEAKDYPVEDDDEIALLEVDTVAGTIKRVAEVIPATGTYGITVDES